MRDSKSDFEEMGFSVKSKPKKVTGKPIKKPMVKPVQKTVVIEKQVSDQSALIVVDELKKSNTVMQAAINALTETMKDMGYRPTALKCHNIERNTQTGLMKSFEIKVIE